MKRDGDTVLGSVSAELLYDESSTSRMGSVVPQVEFIPKISQQLQDSPAAVIRDFEEIRGYCESTPLRRAHVLASHACGC